jgi:hypothetical protein
LKSGNDFLPLRPHTLISLWDMTQFLLHEFADFWEELLLFKKHFEDVGIKSPGDVVSGDAHSQVESLVSHLHYLSKKLQMPNSIDRIWRLQLRLERDVCTNSIIMAELQAIHNVMEYEMDRNYFAFIPAVKISFFENDGLFDENVKKAFPFALADIKEAGNCLAADLNTAAACILMRLAEVGLRELARELGVEIKHDLEFADWEEIIKGIRAKLTLLEGDFRDAARQNKLTFYHAMLDDVKRFKILRHETMHARCGFDADRAKVIFNEVKTFLTRLAAKVLAANPAPH